MTPSNPQAIRYQALMNNSLDSIYVIDINGNVVEVNAAFCKLLGYTQEEACQLNIADWNSQYSKDEWPTILKNFGIKSALIETVHHRKDGALLNVEVSIAGVDIGGTTYFFTSCRDITERKAIEQSLKAREERFQTLFDRASEGILIVSTTGKLIAANEAFARMHGYTPQEMQNMNLRDLDPPESSSKIPERMQRLMKEGSLTFEVDNYHKDGHIFPMEVSASLINIDGEPVIQSFSRDITERKLMQNALAESDEQLRSLISTMSEGLTLQDENSAILAFNKSAERILGLNSDQLSGRTSLDPRWYSVHEDGSPFPGETHPVVMTLKTGLPQSDVIMGIHKPNGDLTWISINAQPIFKEDKTKPYRVVATMHDITERKKALISLAESENRLRAIINNEPECIKILDAEGALIQMNPAGLAMIEADSFEQVAGKQVQNIIAPEYRKAFSKMLKNVIAGESVQLEFQINGLKGARRWLESHSVPMQDRGKPVLLSVTRDITGRKSAEEELRVAAAAFNTHEAIMITDANANIIRVNQAFQDITGYSSEDVLGKNPRILSSGRQDSEFYAAMWQDLLKKFTWSGEVWDKRKNGQTYPKWLTITAVKDNAGNTTEYVAIFSDITARKQAEEEIYSLAYYDILTKLPNRRFLLDRMQQALSVSVRSKNYGALLFLDMDRFKTLNDTMGHDYGDLFLIEIARRLQQCVREVDTVGRIGGDEYVVLIEEINLNAEEASQKVALVAEKIRVSLAAPYLIKKHEYHSSPSVGVSLYRGNEQTVETILKQADMAMYQAKESGGNAVRYFDPAMQLAVETRALLEADMRHAVPEKQLLLYYQIQLDSELRPLGAEALIRWIHPVRGMVSPAQFIPIAEESTLILDIGHWVLESACKQLALWSKHDQTQHLELAINVSAQQFKRQDFVDTITRMVNIHNINPNLLKLELTETVVLSDVADVITKMHLLKALGIRLSLDDFGTGYSSLSYLKQLPLDQIKIDQSFVRDMTTDPNDAVMVQTIINLAHNFRINVIAEGVETQAQLKLLKDNGCMAFQGYLFSKPVPIDQFEALLMQS